MEKRARFDVVPGRGPARSALRRITSPTELSPTYLEVLSGSAMIESLACLIGQGLRLHHSKMNSKLPGAVTVVKWHQNFTFDPLSNADMVTCLLFLDGATLENGPLISLWRGGRGGI
ncbi:MAG: phytanoyl-CoA dioxygenase family protein [Alphaproteobacteria bacterium]|nr:phytanoyl-CoA dioxygenase family protein [Alphaproteobacteria bacterium]